MSLQKIINPLDIPIAMGTEELQRTEQWYRNRWGCFTSSKLAVINAPKGLGETGKSYLNQLLYERLDGEPSAEQIEIMEKDISWEMKLGKTYEDEARNWLSAKLGVQIDLCGFIPYPYFEGIGGDSSDGICIIDGFPIPVELKVAVKGGTFAMRTETVSEKHKDFWQLMGHIYAYNAPYCIYAVYDPTRKPENRLYYQKVMRSDIHIKRCFGELQNGKMVGGTINECNELIEKAIQQKVQSVNEVTI